MIFTPKIHVCGCFCVLAMLANLGFYENQMYSELNGIEIVAKYYVFVKWFQVFVGSGNVMSPEKRFKNQNLTMNC